MPDPNEIVGLNSRLERSVKSTLNGFPLQMLRSSVVENTLC